MSVRIIIDSTSDIKAELKDKVTIVPLTVRFGEEEFVDGVTIDHRQFYERLIESDVLPSTSQPTPDAFAQVFEQARQAGDEVVVLTLSAKLSGTYQSAAIAAADFPGMVHVVDTKTVTIAAGVLVELAIRLMEQGLSAAEIAARITEERENVHLVAMLDTLEYLKLGGRISKTVAFAGGLLNIKPVISIIDGEVAILGKARGSKQGNNLLVKEIEKAGGVDFTKPILLGYTGLDDTLLQKYIEDSQALWAEAKEPLYCAPIGSVIGTHAGPGAVAAAFFKK